MELLFRRHIWIVDLIGILIGAALAGHATATLIGAVLPPHVALPPLRARPAIAAPTAAHDGSIEDIVGRNIFCSTCGDAPTRAPTARPLTLLAIMFAPPPLDPCGSVAIVRDDETLTAGPYVVGARLRDTTVTAIEDVRVVLDAGNGRREVLELLVPRSAGPGDAGRGTSGRLGDGVKRTGTHSYEVRRAVLDQLLAGGVTPPWPRVVPHTRDGAPVGFRLLGLRSDSPLVAIGLGNGDLLLQANGRSLATPDAALAAFTALRAADHVWLTIERDGRPIRIDYTIR